MAKKTIKFNVRGVESGGDFDKPVPVGLYRARVQEVEHTESKSSGNEMLKVTYEIARGDHKGRLAWDYIVLNENNAWKLRQFLEAVGLVKGKKERGTLDLAKIAGTEVQLKLKHETDDTYGTRHKVGSVLPMPDEDDDDEDEYDEDDEDIEDEDVEEDEDDDEEEDDEDDEDEDEDEDEDDDEEVEEVEDYNDLSVDELRAELRERGLKATGKKSLLVKRLEKDDEEDEDGEPF